MYEAICECMWMGVVCISWSHGACSGKSSKLSETSWTVYYSTQTLAKVKSTSNDKTLKYRILSNMKILFEPWFQPQIQRPPCQRLSSASDYNKCRRPCQLLFVDSTL